MTSTARPPVQQFRRLKKRLDRIHIEAIAAMQAGDWDRVLLAIAQQREILEEQTTLVRARVRD